MKRRLLFALMSVIMIGLLAIPAWTSAAVDSAGPINISLEFQWIRQGRVGLVRVTGADVTEVHAVFQERVFHFYPDAQGFTGLISADMTSEIGPYTMQLSVKYANGTTERIDQVIEVNYGEFGSINVLLSAAMAPLLEPAVEEAEMAQLFNIMTRFTPVRYWENSGFTSASTGTEIGWFGTWRLFNDTYWRRHTGIDVRIPIGTPVVAIAHGRVMLAEEMAIRGGYILIDHGWGVYSGYAHLSRKLVVPGQWVRQGDVIGMSGLNGRSLGAHLHWEVAVGGAWTDPTDFVMLNLDAASAPKQP